MRLPWLLVVATMQFGVSCKHESMQSAVKIQDGIATTDNEFASIVRIDFDDGRLCTGSFVHQNVVLTAAHCLFDSEFQPSFPTLNGSPATNFVLADREFGERFRAFRETLPMLEGSKVVHPEIVEFSSRDIALVYFRDTSAAKMGIPVGSLRPIYNDVPEVGDNVVLAGFGLNGAVNGVKHYGNNTVEEVRGGAILVRCGEADEMGQDSCGDRGDSGGTLFHGGAPELGDEQIIGVVSFNPSSGGQGYSYYASVSGPQAIKMFKQAKVLGLPEIAYYDPATQPESTELGADVEGEEN